MRPFAGRSLQPGGGVTGKQENTGSSGETPPVAHRPEEKERQPEGKAGPVILRQAVSPALENKLTSFQGKR